MTESSVLSKSRLKCREIMSQNITSATAETNLQEAARLLRESDVGILPIVDENNKLIGLVTDRDIVVRAVAEGLDASETTVERIMTTETHTAQGDDFAFQAVRTMGEEKVRRIPIVDDNYLLVGMVSMADIVLEMEDEKEIAETLEEISSGAAFWSKR